MKQKINLRLALIAVIAIIATMMGVTIVYYNLFRQQVKDGLEINARLLGDTGLFQQIYSSDHEKSQEGQKELSRLNTESLRITWIDTDGLVLYDNDTDVSELGNHLNRPEIQQALSTGEGECVRKSDTLKMNTFYYALRLSDGTILRVSMEALNLFSVFWIAAPVMILIVLLIIAICILIGHFLTGSIIQPIEMMAEHLDSQMEVPVYKELKPFADKIRNQHEDVLAAVKIRQDFTANVSHELKTPLTAISGYAELLENHMVDEKQQDYIAHQIRKSASRLLSLINDIIKLSELDHKELPRQYQQINLGEAALLCCENLNMNAEQKKVNLICSGTSAILTADRDLVRELIMNLIQNAIQYNNENGYVRVNTGMKEGHAYICVEDNGIGIPTDQQERIFERFYRVDKSRSRETGGTGLGLAIVKHIVEIHDASIKVDSEMGKGTKITVTF